METPDALDFVDELKAHLGTEALFRTLSDINAVTSLGTGTIIFSRKQDPDGHLEENLRAVALATTLGLKSIDNTRKRYANLPTGRDDHPRSAYVRAYERAMAHVRMCRDSLQTNERAPLTLGMYAGAVAMERLVHTMFSAHLLYQLRLQIEADAVARLALEQIAWSVAIARLEDHDAIDAQQPQRSISALKTLVTEPHPGRLYSYLSAAAHAGVVRHQSVFEVDERGRGVIRQGVTDWAGSAQVMMSLADLWVIAYEAVQRDHLPRTVSLLRAPSIGADPERTFLAEMIDTVRAIRDLEVAQRSGASEE